MKHFRIIAAISAVALCMSLPVAGHAMDVQSLAQQAQQAASAGKTSRALGLYELALRQSVDQPESVSGPLQGRYWRLIGQAGDFSRAYDFFSSLLRGQKNPGATLLATEASATGGYIGWLYQNNLAAEASPAMVSRMDAAAAATMPGRWHLTRTISRRSTATRFMRATARTARRTCSSCWPS